MNLLGRCACGFVGCAPFGAAASQAAFLTAKRSHALERRVGEAGGDEREDEEMLKPDGHQESGKS